jgi:hypothetical protein
MSFDGVDERFAVGTTSLGITSAISVSAWVKIPTTNTGGGGTNIQVIACEDNTGGGQRNWNLFWRGTGYNYFVFNVYHTNLTSSSITSTGIVPNDGQWHHLLATFDGTTNANGLKLYVDGTLFQKTATSTGINSYAPTETTIGTLTGGANWRLEGNIDEVSIWNSDQSSNASSIYNGGVPTDLTSLSPLGWWRMGDGDTWNGSTWTLTDNGSGGNDATSVNMEEGDRLPISPSSFSLNSFSFDGVDEYIEVGSPTSIQSLTSAITISFWIKAPRVFSTNYYTPLSKGEYAAVGSQWSIKVNTANLRNTSGGSFSVFPNSNAITDNQSVSFPTAIDDNQWHHLMCVNDGTDLKIYLDGQLEATALGKGRTLYNGNRSLRLGRLTSSTTQKLIGNLDEVAIFGTALGLTEAQTIFNNGIPQDISSLSPISWWRMGEEATWSGSAWTLTDQGSGGNNATSVNMEEGDKTGDQPYVP